MRIRRGMRQLLRKIGHDHLFGSFRILDEYKRRKEQQRQNEGDTHRAEDTERSNEARFPRRAGGRGKKSVMDGHADTRNRFVALRSTGNMVLCEIVFDIHFPKL